MPLSAPEKQFSAEVSKLLHAEKIPEAARWVAEVCKIKFSEKQSQDPAKATPLLQSYLHNLLEADGLVEAAQMLWSPTQFNPNPQSARDVWKLFDESSTGLIMGGAKLSKSFSMGVRLFLEWIRDPEYTSIRVLGPSENHLEENMFSHLAAPARNSSDARHCGRFVYRPEPARPNVFHPRRNYSERECQKGRKTPRRPPTPEAVTASGVWAAIPAVHLP